MSNYSPPFKNEFNVQDNEQMIKKINSFEPDVLFIATRESANDKISIGLQSVFNEDYHAQLLTSANRSDDWLTNADPTVTEGMRGILAAPAVETAAFLGYASRLQAAYGIDPTLFADSVYDCIYLLALAIEQGTFSTSLAIGANLQSVSVSGATLGKAQMPSIKSMTLVWCLTCMVIS